MACTRYSPFIPCLPPDTSRSSFIHILIHIILFHSVGLVRRFEDRRGRRPLSTNMYRVVSCLERRVRAHCGGVILVWERRLWERRLRPQRHRVPCHIGSTIAAVPHSTWRLRMPGCCNVANFLYPHSAKLSRGMDDDCDGRVPQPSSPMAMPQHLDPPGPAAVLLTQRP